MKFSKILTLYIDFVDPLPFLSPEKKSFCISRKKKNVIYNGLIEIQTWNFLHLLRQEIKVPLLRLMRSTLSQTLPQNCRVGVDNHANHFVAVHAKLGRYCRRRHRCEYFAPVWGSLTCYPSPTLGTRVVWCPTSLSEYSFPCPSVEFHETSHSWVCRESPHTMVTWLRQAILRYGDCPTLV